MFLKLCGKRRPGGDGDDNAAALAEYLDRLTASHVNVRVDTLIAEHARGWQRVKLTALHLCVRYDRVAELEVLLRHVQRTKGEEGRRTIVDCVESYDGRTALHYAAFRYTDVDAVRVLLDHGADPNARDRHGDTPLYVACKFNNVLRKIKALLRAGADVNCCERGKGALHVACTNGSTATVELLLQYGADVDEPYKGTLQQTPLMEAVREEAFDVARVLLARGADVDRQDAMGLTALHYCGLIEATPQAIVFIRFLVDIGADPTVQNSAGDNSLEHAIRYAAGDVVIAILRSAVDEYHNQL